MASDPTLAERDAAITAAKEALREALACCHGQKCATVHEVDPAALICVLDALGAAESGREEDAYTIDKLRAACGRYEAALQRREARLERAAAIEAAARDHLAAFADIDSPGGLERLAAAAASIASSLTAQSTPATEGDAP